MKIVVIGGTGRIGSTVVASVREQGHEALPASPATGVNSLTGDGLDEALRGADVLVDVSNSPSFADDAVLEFFQTATGNLIRAARAANVAHYVALSVVGADRLPESGYLRAKVAQEQMVGDSGLGWSVPRATQFFEFAGSVADSATVDGEVRLSGGHVRPAAAAEIALEVARSAMGEPLNGRREIGGPDVFGVDEWIRTVLTARNDPRPVRTDPNARYFGAIPEDESLVPGAGATITPTSLTDWLAHQPARH